MALVAMTVLARELTFGAVSRFISLGSASLLTRSCGITFAFVTTYQFHCHRHTIGNTFGDVVRFSLVLAFAA